MIYVNVIDSIIGYSANSHYSITLMAYVISLGRKGYPVYMLS